MAGPWFVRSGAAGAGTGADWANAFTTLTAANTASTAGGGEIFWIADDHAESTAGAVTLTSKGVVGSLNFYYCVDHNIASPSSADLKTTGSISTSGANAITLAGVYYFYGVIFNSGSGGVNTTLIVGGAFASFEGCQLNKRGLNASAAAITISATDWLLKNTTASFGNVGDNIRASAGSVGKWINTPTAIQGATIPTTLILPTAVGVTELDGVDLSALGSGTVVGALTIPARVSLARCKLGASAVIAATPTVAGALVDAIQCDDGATNYRQTRVNYQGTLTQETTIVRTGGASDGTTPLSWKLVSTANSRWVLPFESFPIAIWNDTVGSPVTATVEIVAAGALNTDDLWIEVEYLGSTLTPQAGFSNGTKANNLATGTALTVSTATWASSPGAPQKLTAVFTPQMKGYIYVRVYLAKASQTVYVDPLVTLS